MAAETKKKEEEMERIRVELNKKMAIYLGTKGKVTGT